MLTSSSLKIQTSINCNNVKNDIQQVMIVAFKDSTKPNNTLLGPLLQVDVI